MGIQVEYNPDLALRNISEFHKGKRKKAECIPGKLIAGKTYPFLKKDQRLYWLCGELPLLETKGGGVLSAPVASIKILESTHFVSGGVIWTKGKYKVKEVFKDNKIHFNGFTKIK
jgi:hypothetical protein